MPETDQPFVHLRVHSAHSLLEGALTIPHLVTLVAEQRMPALALTDTNNLFGALEFSESLAQARIQPMQLSLGKPHHGHLLLDQGAVHEAQDAVHAGGKVEIVGGDQRRHA